MKVLTVTCKLLKKQIVVVKSLQTADYKLNNRIVDHVLVRASLAAYEGSTAGDDIVLKWNNLVTLISQGDTVDVQSFDGEFNGIDNNFITGT